LCGNLRRREQHVNGLQHVRGVHARVIGVVRVALLDAPQEAQELALVQVQVLRSVCTS
jgi:hypothetical protein